jgi:hypothetical protein
LSRFFPAILTLTGTLLFTTAGIGVAQDSSGPKSWSGSSQQGDSAGTLNPSRTTNTHSESNGRVVDKTSMQTLGPDGRYVPYSQTEKESVRVNATTVRSTERTFGTGPDGEKVLIQETREERRELPGGDEKVVRTVSNPDANGALQVIRRELVDSKKVSPGVQERNTTVLSADGSGGMSEAVRVHEREKTNSDGTVEFSKSTQLSDGAGKWNLNEVRQGTLRPDGKQGTTKEENILRPDAEGKMAVVERDVSKQSNAAGESRDVTETYSTNVPGQADNSGLQLVRRESTVTRPGSGGQTSTRRVETANPGNPGDALRVTEQAIDIVRPDGRGSAQQQSTTVTFGPDGQVSTMLVDIGKTSNPASVSVSPRTATSARARK